MGVLENKERSMTELAFTTAEFHARIAGAQRLMTEGSLDAIVINSQKNVEYFSGFESDLWASPTRPFYVLIPREGDPVAVVPQGGDVPWLASSWVKQLETWPAPRPANEGVDEVAALLKAMPRRFGRVGLEMGPESRIGMTLADALKLIEAVKPMEVADASVLCRALRIIKSPAEVARIRKACTIASNAFARLPSQVKPGMLDKEVVSVFSASMLADGADKVSFIAMGSGPGGYRSIIGRAENRVMATGDIFGIDTGAEVGGYFCDFDRSMSMGPPDDASAKAYEILYQATDAGIAAAKPGNRASDLYHAQVNCMTDLGGKPATMGRYGHGLGLALTEWPSNKPDDDTELKPGMVMTIEPGVDYGDGKVMVQEENLVITEDGCEMLSHRAPREMPVVG